MQTLKNWLGGTSPPLFLGLDLSTQQLKAIIISEDGSIVHEHAVNFDKDLPHYNTTNGAILGPDKGEVTSPVMMWLEAFDLLFDRLKDAKVDLSNVHAVSGAGQQHGSVYWSSEASMLLAHLDPAQGIAGQLSPQAFSLPNAPIWQDSSSTEECLILDESVGGQQALADLTGSRAYERFTGPQIAKIRRKTPEAYSQTSRISLVSSFMPSLFLGKFAPIEISDASGMNLMNVLTHKWDDKLLETCGGPYLRQKLGEEPVPGGITLGKVADYWVKRYGLNSDCLVAPFTGDNPASMVSLSTPGDAILSLGTSTTFLLAVPPADTPPKRFTSSHLLAHPTTLSAQIGMLCYKNGALAREQVRDKHARGSWDTFNNHVTGTPPGNNGYMGLYFPMTEIIPPNVQGEFLFKETEPIDADAVPADAHPRAILESQFLSIKSRVTEMLPADAPPLHRLVVTGGTTANSVIVQLAADLFGLPAYIAETKEAAGCGGALLALYAWWREKNGGAGTFEELKAGLKDEMKLVAEPHAEVTKVYEGLIETYRSCEAQVVQQCAERLGAA